MSFKQMIPFIEEEKRKYRKVFRTSDSLSYHQFHSKSSELGLDYLRILHIGFHSEEKQQQTNTTQALDANKNNERTDQNFGRGMKYSYQIPKD